ncbi:MAG TPA: hypothetical protein VMF90_10015 [Rhizobiaceae bacterium]|nr:hypothetical protein [Rhizobiaceae bacterium]
MSIDHAHTIAEKPHTRIALECAIALAGLCAAFFYTGETKSSSTADPTILEADGGNVMSGLKLSGRGEWGEIRQ